MVIAEERPPAGWEHDPEGTLSERALKALGRAGTLTELASLCADGLVALIKMPDGGLRPFRTIDVVTGVDTSGIVKDSE